ncbi:MAG: hypothetical protein HOO96_44465, partial [Polyangiaceae bacterium]|nr:hypothetical protein [Polyangiaceae bacterium]
MADEDLELPPADGDVDEEPTAGEPEADLETPDDEPWDDAESDHLGIPDELLENSRNAKENQSLDDDSEGLDEDPGGVLPLLEEVGLLAEGEGPGIEGLYELDPEMETADDGGAEGPAEADETLGELPPLDADEEGELDPASLFDRLRPERAEWRWSDRAWDRREVVSGPVLAAVFREGAWLTERSLSFAGPVVSLAAAVGNVTFAVLADGTLWRLEGDRLTKLGRPDEAFSTVVVFGDDLSALGQGRLHRGKVAGNGPLEDLGPALAVTHDGEAWLVARDGGGEIHVGRGADVESAMQGTAATFAGEHISHLGGRGKQVAARVDGTLRWSNGSELVALPATAASALALVTDRRGGAVRSSLLAALPVPDGTLFVLFDGRD